MKRYVLFICTAFLFSSCVKFSNPIVPYSDSIFDESILGLWAEESSQSDNFLLILGDSKLKKYKIISFQSENYSFDADEFGNSENIIYTGKFNDDNYLICYFSEISGYYFLKYKADDNFIYFYNTDDNIIEEAIISGQLSGTVSGENIKKEITVDTGTGGLQAFFEKNRNLLFNEDCCLKYKKIHELK